MLDVDEDLEQIRSEINRIDKEMATLFEQRMKAVEGVGAYKMERGLPVSDPSREQAVIERNVEYIENKMYRGYYTSFIKNTMKLAKQYQHSLLQGQRIAYAGIEGSFSSEAAGIIFPDSRVMSFSDFAGAYNAVVDGECESCVIPIENSYNGEVAQTVDLLFMGDLYINGIYDLAVSQNLLGVRGASLSDVKTVISHPQALGQCEKYINEHGFATLDCSNTAVAAKNVSESGDRSVAAIASKKTAELYNLEILDTDINDSAENTTRFLALSRYDNRDRTGRDDGVSVLLFTAHSEGNEVGALAKIVGKISEYGFNMRVLRSRPTKRLVWDYYFYVEIEGNLCSERGKRLMTELKPLCGVLKNPGCVARGPVLKD